MTAPLGTHLPGKVRAMTTTRQRLAERTLQVAAERAAFDRDTREMFALCQKHGLTLKQAADIAGVPRNTLAARFWQRGLYLRAPHGPTRRIAIERSSHASR